jgi:hypothetical protein
MRRLQEELQSSCKRTMTYSYPFPKLLTTPAKQK